MKSILRKLKARTEDVLLMQQFKLLTV